MNPMQRAASIFNSLPAESCARGLVPKACRYFTTSRARGPSRSKSSGNGHPPQWRSGADGNFRQNRWRKAPQKQRSPRQGRGSARNAHYARSRLGALVGSPRRCVARSALIPGGPEKRSWTLSHALVCLKTTMMPRGKFPKTARGRAQKPVPAVALVARCRAFLRGFVLRLQPVVDVFAHHVFGQAIALLYFAFELVALAVDLGKIVVGELTPLLLDLAFGLLPVSFDAVPVHRKLHTVLVSLR